MLWFYSRNKEALTVETRYDNDRGEYVVIIVSGVGQPKTERYATNGAFRARLQQMEQELAAQQWTPDGQPHVLPDGWPDKTPAA